jgi:alpha-amylase
MSEITGHAQIRYSSDRNAALVVIHTRVNNRNGKLKVEFSFNNEPLTSVNRYEVNSNFQKELSIKIVGTNEETKKQYQVELESLNFIWQNSKIELGPQYENGQKGAIVELFGWAYEEIEKECESLGKMGYLGVKVFPPQEGIKSFSQLQNGELNPWYWVYQPVSYKLSSRMGTRAQLRKMIVTCRKHNVRVYADAVINHMTGGGNDAFPSHRNGHGGHCSKWGAKDSFAGSPYYTHSFAFEKTFAKEVILILFNFFRNQEWNFQLFLGDQWISTVKDR